MTSQPSAYRCISASTAAAMASFILAMAPVGPNPPLDPHLLLGWWAEQGTPTATMTAARLAALLLSLWMVVLFAGGAAAGLSRSAHLTRMWPRLTPRRLSELLAIGSVAIGASVPSVTAAADSPAGADVTLVDLGPVESGHQAPTIPPLTDVGPVAPPSHDDEQGRASRAEARTLAEDNRWVVAPGDHLWRVAEETLRDHRPDPTDRDITRYWLQLIAANTDVFGDNPDLIHAGQVLTLPTVGVLRVGS